MRCGLQIKSFFRIYCENQKQKNVNLMKNRGNKNDELAFAAALFLRHNFNARCVRKHLNAMGI